MKVRYATILSMIVLASAGIASSASAQEKTRAEVRQELVQAENNGSRFVTDASYPDMSPVFAQQVAHLKQQNDSGYGAGMSGSSPAGQPATSMKRARRAPAPAHGAALVGPLSFRTAYLGI